MQVGTFPFTVQVADAGPPSQTSAPATLHLTVGTNLGRNDSRATATPLSNGTYQASISPISDPPTGMISADSDYYQIAANPGALVTVEIMAQRLSPPSALDSVLELVDANNSRLPFCTSSPSNSAGPFNRPCVNDDLVQGTSSDSRVNLQVPSGNSAPLTFYTQVLDFNGNACPDFIYTITISGAN